MKVQWKTPALLAFCLLVLFGTMAITSFAADCEQIRGEVLRLHVLANSDSKEDQALKLKVRDRVLREGKELFEQARSKDQAEEAISKELNKLEAAAQEELQANGCSMPVKVTLSTEYFNTRTYEKVTLPAGKYRAVRVLIGEAKGKNWWCVMFPPLCLPAAESDVSVDAVLKGGELKVVESNPDYEVRFKIVEWFEKIESEINK